MQGLAKRIRALKGWRAALLAFLTGLLAVAALPPFYGIPVLLIVFPVLIWRLDATTSFRGAFRLGGLFGLGHFLGMIYWVGNAFLVSPEEFGPLAPFAVLGLSAVLAVVPALAFAAARLFWQKGPGRILIFAAAWAAGELLREVYLTGFPWAPIGMTWAALDPMIQSVAFFGITGLSLVTVATFGSVALWGDFGDLKPKLLGLVGSLALLGAIAIGGELRLASYGGMGDWDANGTWVPPKTQAVVVQADSGDDPGGETLFPRVRLVQPAIPQMQKWSAAKLYENIRAHVTLSQLPGLDTIDGVIWAETAVPFALNVAADIRDIVRTAVPDDGVLITGAVRRSDEQDGASQFWNSLFVLNGDGEILATYDKSHLVPFGEYIPLGGLPGVRKLTEGFADFSRGPGLQTLKVDGLPSFSPLICYEVIFPGRVVSKDGPRPGWMVNLTNDGWYGRSTGPYQHFQIARLRAIEEGMSLVRVAGTGISGVVSPLGQTSPTLGLDKAGILDLDVPPPLLFTPPYARWGNQIPVTIALLCGVFGLLLKPWPQDRTPRARVSLSAQSSLFP